MALTFPRDMTTAQCWEVADVTLEWRQELSVQAGGRVQGKDLGPPLWRASLQSYALADAVVDEIEAQFLTLGGVARPFFLIPPRNRTPGAPGATAGLDLTGVSVGAIRADRSAIRLQGLPADFEMKAGDFVSILTEAGGREVVRLVEAATANGVGLTGLTEIVPAVRVSVAVDDPATVVDPPIEMHLEPNGLTRSRHSRTRSRIAIRAVQRIR